MADIALKSRDRAALIGASGTGKSTFAAYLLDRFRADYPHARILVLDTKPRWRAVRQANGTGTRRLYRNHAKGDTIAGSVALSDMRDWGIVWDDDTNPSQTVIAQRLEGSHAVNMRFQIAAAERFFKSQSAKRDSLLYVDEGMDFFTTSASAIGGSDIVQRCTRAGREKGLATLIGAQRPVGINLQILTEMNYAALFRINFVNDMKRLHEMGWPKDIGPPTYDTPHAFRLWREGSPQAPLYQLDKRKAA